MLQRKETAGNDMIDKDGRIAAYVIVNSYEGEQEIENKY